MKSNRGVTLISLIVYIIVLSAVIGMMSLFTKYFYQNVDDTVIANNASEQHSRFLEYFTNDINSGKIDINKMDEKNASSGESSNIAIPLSTGSTHIYVYESNNIYYREFNNLDEQTKNILLCDNVERCSFRYESENKKIIIQMTLSGNMERTNTFTIK